MDRLWGAFEPVPQANVRALAGGETVTAGGHTLQTAYTPGHASHHLAYFDEPSRIAFVGDVAGVSLPPAHVIVPPTPPPDVDVEAWEASVEKILAWHPEALFLTHFGLKSNPAIHLQELMERLRGWARLVKDLMADEPNEDVRRTRFARQVGLELRRSVSDPEALRYGLAIGLEQSYNGLERYWKKKAERAAARLALAAATLGRPQHRRTGRPASRTRAGGAPRSGCAASSVRPATDDPVRHVGQRHASRAGPAAVTARRTAGSSAWRRRDRPRTRAPRTRGARGRSGRWRSGSRSSGRSAGRPARTPPAAPGRRRSSGAPAPPSAATTPSRSSRRSCRSRSRGSATGSAGAGTG